MKQQDVERRLRTALEHAAPDDLDGVLSRCGPQNGKIVPMPARRPRRWVPWLVAACLVLAMGGGFAGLRYQQANTVASVVSLDVNPSIRLEVNRSEKVLSATPLNEDAHEILEDMDLRGADLEVAVNAIVGSLLKHGYVDELANSVLVTVQDEDAARGAALEEKLTGEIAQVLEKASVNGAILSQTFAGDDELRQKAEEYGISQGKAALIQSIVDQSTHLTFESLVGLSINELNLLANSSAAQDKAVQSAGETAIRSTGSASQSGYIGVETAKQAALSHAGVTEDQLISLECDYDYEDGRMVYEVEFETAQAEFEYDIDAATGTILKQEREEKGQPVQTTPDPTQTSTPGGGQESGLLTWQQARDAAYARAGVSAGQVVDLSWDSDEDDGRLVYELEFETAGAEYECKVDGVTGAVLEFEQKGSSSGQSQSGGSAIGTEQAKAIAFDHAGVGAAAVSELEVELDDGCYQVEFQAGGYEYEYEIRASDGTILQAERDD